jgi:hypothetical protein
LASNPPPSEGGRPQALLIEQRSSRQLHCSTADVPALLLALTRSAAQRKRWGPFDIPHLAALA